MKALSARYTALAVAVGLAIPGSSFATNGYFLIGYGAKSRAMGGVGVAYAQDGLAAAANPAAMSDVDVSTMRVDVGGEFFIPRRAARHSSDFLEADEISGSNLFLIPNMGGIYKFNRKITVGMAAIGAGLGTRYNQSIPPNRAGSGYFYNVDSADGPLAGDTVGVSLMQMQMLPSVAYKLNKNHSVGASLAIAVQTFRAYGLGSFETLGFSAGTGNLTNEGNDWSYGAGVRLGWLGSFADKRLKVGANYASRVYMTEFDKYRNLFAEQGDFDIPTHYAIGLSYKMTDNLDVAFDVQRIEFSSIKSVGNPGPVPAGGSGAFFPANCVPADICKTGMDQGLGFGWNDMTVYKLGLAYRHDDKWTFRAGFNYGKAPIKSDELLFNMLAPATVEKHLTIGATYNYSPNLEFSMNIMHAFKNTLTGRTPFWPTGITNYDELTVDNAAISMYQYSIGFSIGYKL